MPNKPRRSQHTSENLELSGILDRVAEPGLLIVDSARQIVAANPPAARLLQPSGPGSNQTSDPTRFLPASLEQVATETIERNQPSTERLIPLENDSGERTVVRASCFPWQNPASPRPLALFVLHDLSTARELEAKTERLQKLATVGTLSAGVAHEIKNALVAVKSFVELLLEKEPDDAASLVRCEVGRIDLLISQLLRFAGPGQPAFGPTRVHELLRNSLRLVQHQIKTHGIQENLLLNAGQDLVDADARQLQQAFLNLLLNAVDAMNRGGTLTLRTEVVLATEHISRFEPEKREPQIQIEIRDAGPGIPSEILARLFTPFVTNKPGGTGLGLAITRRILREHHGSITVETKPGHGTTFRILLPLVRSANPEICAPVPA